MVPCAQIYRFFKEAGLQMDNFEFHNPVKIIFGRRKVAEAGVHVSRVARTVLLCTGMGSVKKNGIFDTVVQGLDRNGVSWVELEGIQSNPLLSKVREGIEIVRREGLEAVMAVGGGSVMDTAKAVAAGSLMERGDIWDCFLGKEEIKDALPVVTVPTLAASGSEMNGFMVITNEKNMLKLAAGSPHVYPVISILDPELTYTVPANYTAYGGVDAICHLLEPFFNGSWPDTPIQDGITYGLVKAIIQSTDACLKSPQSYTARANLMWGATLALNGLTKAGVGQHFFPVHLIEHSLSALYHVPHGAGLSALLPGWMEWYADSGSRERIAEFGCGVYGLDKGGTDAELAVRTILIFSRWLKSIGCPWDLAHLSIPVSAHADIAENAMVQGAIWGIDQDYTKEVIVNILDRCARRDI